MTGSQSSTPQDKPVQFYLDECLPYQVADALRRVGYSITSWHDDSQSRGEKDPQLIPRLGSLGYTWITKDSEARTEHGSELRAAQISVVWIGGLERKRLQNVSVKDLHRMLTDKLDQIGREIADANGPRYFFLYMKSGNVPVLKRTSLEEALGSKIH